MSQNPDESAPPGLAELQARAEAAEAEAAAAQAAPAAAQQGAGAASLPAAAPTGGTPTPVPAPTPATSATSSGSALAQAVAAGYAFTGPTLALGALLEDGIPVPSARVALPLGMLNRHALVAGATGKTRTLQLMAEQLSSAGVPVFVADVKGDLTGLAVAGTPSDKLTARTQALGQQWSPAAFPVEFYALAGLGHGVPVRTTISEFGPLLLSKVLGLNQTQESSLGLIFHWADQKGLPLLDLKDLRETVTPKDLPADVLGQLGSRAQHALRAFTPDDAAALRAAARTYPTSSYDLEQTLQQLGTGEAIVTVLSDRGTPTPVAWTRLRAPQASMAAAPDATVQATVAASAQQAKYGTAVDRQSAYEMPTAFDSILRVANSPLGRQITRSVLGTLLKR